MRTYYRYIRISIPDSSLRLTSRKAKQNGLAQKLLDDRKALIAYDTKKQKFSKCIPLFIILQNLLSIAIDSCEISYHYIN